MICAGIVTYNPDISLFKECLGRVAAQVDKVYIADNGSGNVSDVIRCAGEVGCCHNDIICNEDNLGIARALNQVCEAAYNDGYQWILTMDQDSVCDYEMVAGMIPYADQDNIGILAPEVEFRTDKELIASTKKFDTATQNIRACITSGSLMNLKAWKQIGGFDEWLFIDHVDNEICTHLIKEGYSVVRVRGAKLYQRAGEMKYKKLLSGKKILLPYYSKFRNYYICRNSVFYIRKYKKEINVRHESCVLIYSQLVKLLFERKRWDTLTSTVKGIVDGFRAPIVDTEGEK